jgi:hypothetical protein
VRKEGKARPHRCLSTPQRPAASARRRQRSVRHSRAWRHFVPCVTTLVPGASLPRRLRPSDEPPAAPSQPHDVRLAPACCYFSRGSAPAAAGRCAGARISQPMRPFRRAVPRQQVEGAKAVPHLRPHAAPHHAPRADRGRCPDVFPRRKVLQSRPVVETMRRQEESCSTAGSLMRCGDSRRNLAGSVQRARRRIACAHGRCSRLGESGLFCLFWRRHSSASAGTCRWDLILRAGAEVRSKLDFRAADVGES